MTATKLLFSVLMMLASANIAVAETLRLAVTTSFNNSGLSDILIPEIRSDTGIEVQLLVVGTGQALKLGRLGDVDAILVHSRIAEETFISEGFATHRREIMYNDFVLVGPQSDPATIRLAQTAAEALGKIRQEKANFVSRGDDSGTHRKEQSLWKLANLAFGEFSPDWYREAGSGMGATLNTASGMNAYTLSDRASWLKFSNKGELELLFSGDPVLFNQYSYLPINPERHSHVRADLAKKLEAWLTGDKAQKMIGAYTIAGQALFVPNVNPSQ